VEKIRRESMLGTNHATRKEVVVLITGISLFLIMDAMGLLPV
jgi:hypothetical protein